MLRFLFLSLLLPCCCALAAQDYRLRDPAPFTTVGLRMVMLDHELPNDFKKNLQKSYALEILARHQYTKHFGLMMPIRFGNADVGQFRNLRFGAIDFLARVTPFGNENKVSPFLQAGYGITFEQDARAFRALPFGAGFEFKIGKDMWVSLQAEYRATNRENRDNLNASLGYIYRFGQPDLRGCPDIDGDGVPDDIDNCPNTPGSLYTGCPDSDNDGFEDQEDDCPNVAGPNRGCPEVSPALQALMERATNRVTFEGRSATLTAQSLPMLDEIAVNLRANPSFKLTIEGHTDNTGTLDNNERLSRARAVACRGYLVSKGIDAGRVKVLGYGASRPKGDNATVVGRELNNRVEFSVVNH